MLRNVESRVCQEEEEENKPSPPLHTDLDALLSFRQLIRATILVSQLPAFFARFLPLDYFELFTLVYHCAPCRATTMRSCPEVAQ